MSKNNKKTKKNLGKNNKNQKNQKKKNNSRKQTICQSCNLIRFGGNSIKYGGGCGCNSKKKIGGTPNMDKLPTNSYYPLNNYENDVSWTPYVKSSTLLGDFSRISGGNNKTKKMRRNKKGGGILNFFSLPSYDYVTTNNTLGGIYTQKDILAGNQIVTSDPTDQPLYKNPYGSTNPPLI
jgi:hypothetical protein